MELRLLIATASLAVEHRLWHVQAEQLWCMGLAAWWPVGSSGTRRVPNHGTTRGDPITFYISVVALIHKINNLNIYTYMCVCIYIYTLIIYVYHQSHINNAYFKHSI